MILHDNIIEKSLDSGTIVIKPRPKVIQPASVDLHLSEDLLYFPKASPIIDIAEGVVPEMKTLTLPKEGHLLYPGEFILGSTMEWVEIPNDIVARVEGKSSLGRIGLFVHITAGFIDPGFRGNITLELRNGNNVPINLRSGMPISQICFHLLRNKTKKSYGEGGLGSKYQNSKGTKPPIGWKKG